MPVSRHTKRPHKTPLAFIAYQEGVLKRLREAQEKANAKREAETRPRVIRPLVVAVDPKTGERRVISELRREHWPETNRFLPAPIRYGPMSKVSSSVWGAISSWFKAKTVVLTRRLSAVELPWTDNSKAA